MVVYVKYPFKCLFVVILTFDPSYWHRDLMACVSQWMWSGHSELPSGLALVECVSGHCDPSRVCGRADIAFWFDAGRQRGKGQSCKETQTEWARARKTDR